MTDLDCQVEYFADKYYSELEKGREPITEGDDFIEDAVRKWEEEDDGIIDELEMLAKAKKNDSDWEEVSI